MSELRECPFCECGGKKIFRRTGYINVSNSRYLSEVGCVNRECPVMPRISVQKEDFDGAIAIKKWNTRTSSPDGDWQKDFADKFREHYKGILSDDVIDQSIKWHVEFMGLYIKHLNFPGDKELKHE